MATDIAGDTMTGHASDARRDFLDRRHQRIGHQHRPADAEAELRTRLTIGADAGRIVVGCPGDQPRSETLQEPLDLSQRSRVPTRSERNGIWSQGWGLNEGHLARVRRAAKPEVPPNLVEGAPASSAGTYQPGGHACDIGLTAKRVGP